MSDPRPPQRLGDPLAQAARRAAAREKEAEETPEPSMGSRLGQIGVLGWSIVLPVLGGVFVGRWLDHTFKTGISFSAPAILLGVAFGFWSAWKWMHRP